MNCVLRLAGIWLALAAGLAAQPKPVRFAEPQQIAWPSGISGISLAVDLNGDGYSDLVSASLTGTGLLLSDGKGGYQAPVTLPSGAESAGLHTLAWDGVIAGSSAPEGKWTFIVTGTDDRNVTSSAQRTFSLDDTLSSLAVTIGRGGRPTATFQLTRAASVVVQVQRSNGVPVATLRSGPRAAGPEHATWRGRIDGRRAPAGRYLVAVRAKSSVGTSSLAAPFSWRAHTRH